MIDLEGLISISGKPGIYRLLTSSSKSVILESIETGKRFPSSPTASISSLSDIQIYTKDDEVSLEEVFQRIHDVENGGKAIDHRSSKEELKERFEEILPEYDPERVYPSDIKKCFQWYNLLHDAGALKQKEENQEDEGEKDEADEEKNDGEEDQKE